MRIVTGPRALWSVFASLTSCTESYSTAYIHRAAHIHADPCATPHQTRKSSFLPSKIHDLLLVLYVAAIIFRLAEMHDCADTSARGLIYIFLGGQSQSSLPAKNGYSVTEWHGRRQEAGERE